jgi:ketosteroid isomerase-like protein
MSANIDLAQRWITARNARDAEKLLELSTPDVEKHLARGVARGEEGIREWVQRMSFGAAPYIELDRFYERGDTVVARGRTQFRWAETGEPAGEFYDGGFVFRFAHGRVALFEPISDFDAALAGAGLVQDDLVG